MSDDKLIRILRSLPLFARNFLNIRTKAGRIEPFILNRAQNYLHERLEAQLKETGKVRALCLKGRQQGCCFAPHMRVITSDYHWKEIGDVEVGDELIGCDEETYGITKAGRKHSRKLRTSVVEHVASFTKMTHEVLLDNGARLEVTGDHRMMTRQRGGDYVMWREVKDFRVGDLMRVVTRPPGYGLPSYEDGWVAGMIDGEGSWRGKNGGAKRLSIHHRNNAMLRRLKDYFDGIGMPYKEVIDSRVDGINKLGRDPVHRLDIHRLPYLIEMFARCRPTRFTHDKWYEGHELPGKGAVDGVNPWARVVSIKSLEKKHVIDLQTSTKTFICEGLVSHNSTYVQARFFHKVSTQRGRKAFILTHEAEATKNLFDMTKRYYDSVPDGVVPKPDASSARELNFKSLNSGYAVGTAGNKAVGRSQTVQLMHASEVAYFPHAEEHAKGILQSVSNEDGTEIIMESTANGIGNYFYNMWMSATSGQSDFQGVFIPWFWQSEYTADARKDESESLSDEEQELFDEHEHNGLTKRHLYWRRRKLFEFSNDFETARELFQVEYPMTALEAFRNPVADRFIKSNLVNQARKRTVESNSQLVIGVDPAISDHDRTAVIRRKGRLMYSLETHFNMNTMEIVGMVRRMIDKECPAKVCIDCIGIGAGIVDRLHELGYSQVEGINVARSASDKDKFKNLRAELWHDMREWLAQDMPVQVPDSDELLGDLTSLGYKFDSSGRLQIESKDELRKRGMKSPDCGDAACLTFFVGDFVAESYDNQRQFNDRTAGMLI